MKPGCDSWAGPIPAGSSSTPPGSSSRNRTRTRPRAGSPPRRDWVRKVAVVILLHGRDGRVFLDADGDRAVDPGQPLSPALQRKLMLRSVTLSTRALVAHLRDLDTPPGRPRRAAALRLGRGAHPGSGSIRNCRTAGSCSAWTRCSGSSTSATPN